MESWMAGSEAGHGELRGAVRPPFDLHWAAGGQNTAYYQMSQSQAEKWLAARAAARTSDSESS